MDALMTLRSGKATLSGGFSHGVEVTDTCFVVNSPQDLRFCHQRNPTTQIKFNGTYAFPWNLQVSAVFQNLDGIPILANYPATNAQIAPSLGRNLSECAGVAVCNATLTVPLILPNSLREPRQNEVDLRLTRTFPFGTTRLHARFDVYNLFNASDVQNQNNTYGALWRRPGAVLIGRLFKIGAQFDF
jgi:hypothetical protein